MAYRGANTYIYVYKHRLLLSRRSLLFYIRNKKHILLWSLSVIILLYIILFIGTYINNIIRVVDMMVSDAQ